MWTSRSVACPNHADSSPSWSLPLPFPQMSLAKARVFPWAPRAGGFLSAMDQAVPYDLSRRRRAQPWPGPVLLCHTLHLPGDTPTCGNSGPWVGGVQALFSCRRVLRLAQSGGITSGLTPWLPPYERLLCILANSVLPGKCSHPYKWEDTSAPETG